MTSPQSVPAFVHNGHWDEETRAYPPTKAVEIMVNEFDATNVLKPGWYTADASFQKPDGSTHRGSQDVIAAIHEVYAPFTSHYHRLLNLMCVENDEGWKMLAQVELFGNLRGSPAEGESKVKDESGKEWDVVIPAGYMSVVVKDGDAENGQCMALKRTDVMTDSSVVMGILSKRGAI